MKVVAVIFAVSVSPALFAQMNLLAPEGDAWTAAWKPAYGCRVDSGLGDGPVLRQTLPPDFAKGNYSWRREVPVLPGAGYHFGVRYQLREVGEALAQFHFVYPDGSLMDYLNFRASSRKLSGTEETWQDLACDFTAPAGAAAVQVALRLNSPGTVYWDSPTMKMSSPAPDLKFSDDAFDLRDSVGVVARELPPEELGRLNARWFRYNINWASAEGEGKDLWDEAFLAKAEGEIRAAKEAGFNVLVSLGYSPRWAARKTDGVRGGNYVARDLRDWQHFVAVVAGRLGDSADAYRIMNEVNHQWDTGSQPQEYAQFLKSAFATIKAIRPSATVVMAGVSGTPGGYLQEIFRAGAGDSFDVAACQPYVHGRKGPEEGRLVDRLRAYRMVLAENNSSKPIWATEFGYPSEPLDHITPEEQAGLYVRSHLLAISSGAGVTKFFLFLLRDQKGDAISQTGGLYAGDWTLKPVGEAVSTLARLINPMRRYIGEVSLGDDPRVYNRLFEGADGRQVWALWRTEGESELSLEFERPVEKVSWNGVSAAPAKAFRVTLNTLPVYFVGEMPQIAAGAAKEKEISFAGTAKGTDSLPVPWVQNPSDWGRAAQIELKARRNLEAGVIGKAQLLASERGLALKISVVDSSPAENRIADLPGLWMQDSFEVFLNRFPENAPAGFVTDDCYHFIVSPGMKGDKARVYLADKGSKAVQKLLPDAPVSVRVDGGGYTVEFLIPWSAWREKAPRPGDLLGFDLLATRSDSDGKREETAAWSGGPENSVDASLWGVIRLGAPSAGEKAATTSTR